MVKRNKSKHIKNLKKVYTNDFRITAEEITKLYKDK